MSDESSPAGSTPAAEPAREQTPAQEKSPTQERSSALEKSSALERTAATGDRQVSVHILRPAPPVRAFLLAAVLAVLGAAGLVTAMSQQWPAVVQILTAVILAAGLVLLVAAITTVVRMRVRAELTPTGYSFRTPVGVRHGTWADTARVSSSESGHRLTFTDREDETQHVICPVGSESPEMAALVADLLAHLDRSRR